MISIISVWILLPLYLLNTDATTVFKKNFNYIRKNNLDIEINWPRISENEITLDHIDCNNGKDTSTCVIFQETYELGNSSNLLSNKSCTINIGDHSFFPVSFVKFERLSNDTIIFDLIYKIVGNDFVEKLLSMPRLRSQRRLQIVNMTSCQLINQVEIWMEKEIDDFAHLIVRPNKSEIIDVFYTNSNLCISQRTRISYDMNGNVVHEPSCLVDEIENRLSIRESSEYDLYPFSSEKYTMVYRKRLVWNIYLVNYRGNEVKEIARRKCSYHCDKELRMQPRIQPTSDNKYIRYFDMPYFLNNDIDVGLVDIETIEEEKINIDYGQNYIIFETLNLVNDDFLIVVGYEPIKRPSIGSGRDKRQLVLFGSISEGKENKRTKLYRTKFDLTRYSKNGTKISDHISFDGWICQSETLNQRANLVQVADNRVCINFRCKFEKETDTGDWIIDYKFATECLDFQ